MYYCSFITDVIDIAVQSAEAESSTGEAEPGRGLLRVEDEGFDFYAHTHTHCSILWECVVVFDYI